MMHRAADMPEPAAACTPSRCLARCTRPAAGGPSAMAEAVPGIPEMEIELSDDSFCFPAAHLALHGSSCESMHGHTYAVTLRLSGSVDESGMIADFHRVKELMRKTVEPLR